jgi:integrase
MARTPKFKHQHTSRGWLVNTPASLTESGRRERCYFSTRDLAKAHAATLREKFLANGANATAIRPSLAEDASKAAEVLSEWGVSLLEAARFFAAAKSKESASRTLSKAADAWLAACEPLRPRTVRNYKLTADRLRKAFADRLLSAITAEELQAVLAPPGSSGSSCMAELRNGKAFWRWSASKGWCEAEIFAGVEKPKLSKDSEAIAILTPAEAAVLLRTAEVHFPQAVASFALQLFAGIRVEEITRMEAAHVTEDGIDLPPSVTKRGRRRHITPNATLVAWLERFPFKPCPNWRETSAACRRLSGWDVSAVILNERVRVGTMEPLPKPTRGRWPQNALRHSHASYAVASGTALEALLFEFGHSGTTSVLREHYVGAASKKQALQFFSIRPDGETAEAVQLETVEEVA